MQKEEIIRNLILLSLIILCIIFLVIFLKYRNSNQLFKSDSGAVELISSKGNAIEIVDNHPMSDEFGKKISDDTLSVQSYYAFEVKSISNVGTNFEVYVTDYDYKNDIQTNFIKLYLTDENDEPVNGYVNAYAPTYYNLRVSAFNPVGRRIYYGYIGPHESKKFILRVWVGDAYTIKVDSNKFGMKIYAEAE